MNVNSVTLIGNITRDPELKSLPSGNSVCSFSIATNETYVKDGKKIENTEFHNCIAWGKTGENIAQYMKKGSQIYVQGKLQTRSWDKDGEKRYRTEIVALSVQFGAKPSGEGSSSRPRQERSALADEFPDEETGGGSQGGDDGINPEDIPF